MASDRIGLSSTAGADNVPAPLTTRDLLDFATIEGARANWIAKPAA